MAYTLTILLGQKERQQYNNLVLAAAVVQEDFAQALAYL